MVTIFSNPSNCLYSNVDVFFQQEVVQEWEIQSEMMTVGDKEEDTAKSR